jgi:hypothetical protein
MKLSKIVVLVAHDGEMEINGLAETIHSAIAQDLAETHTELIYEVRLSETREVTLGSIDLSLEEGYPLQEAEPVGSKG